jgi:multiple sugar transport system substrate-binding protein
MNLTTHQKRILLTAGFIILLIVFLGVMFHKRNPSPVTLEIWGMSDKPEVFSTFINNFQKNYPYIRINYTLKDESTYHEQLLKAFADNQAPDIFMLWNNWLPYYETRIAPLNLKNDKDFNLLDIEQTYPQIAKNELIKDNYLLGLPLYVDTLMLYYNQDVFNYYNIALPPASWEEVLNLRYLRRVNEQGQITRAAIALGSSDNVNWSFDIISALMMQYNSDIVDTNKKQAIFDRYLLGKNTTPGEETLLFYSQFSNPSSKYYTWNDNFADSVIAFSRGEAVMMIGYNQAQKTIKEYNPSLNYGIAPLPQFAHSSSKINYGNTMSLVVSKNSKHSQESWKFLKFLSQKENARFYFLQTKNPPSRLDLIQEYLNDPISGIFIRQILTSRNWHQYDFQEIIQIFNNMVKDVVQKGKTPAEAVATSAERINFFWNKKE